jgi:hypothetical protein
MTLFEVTPEKRPVPEPCGMLYLMGRPHTSALNRPPMPGNAGFTRDQVRLHSQAPNRPLGILDLRIFATLVNCGAEVAAHGLTRNSTPTKNPTIARPRTGGENCQKR